MSYVTVDPYGVFDKANRALLDTIDRLRGENDVLRDDLEKCRDRLGECRGQRDTLRRTVDSYEEEYLYGV